MTELLAALAVRIGKMEKEINDLSGQLAQARAENAKLRGDLADARTTAAEDDPPKPSAPA
jgi:hypothetical protein